MKSTEKEKKAGKIIISGGGLVGTLLSIFLAKGGYPSTIYEKRPDMRKTNLAAGRSINLALSDRGWKALKSAGIAKDILRFALPMRGRMIHKQGEPLAFQPYGKKDQAIYSVSRSGLNMSLLSLAEKSGVKIRFGQGVRSVEMEKNKLIMENGVDVKYDLLFG